MHVTTMKTKRHYTAPVTQRATVELEGGFCGSISTKVGVESAAHEHGFDNREAAEDDLGFTITGWE